MMTGTKSTGLPEIGLNMRPADLLAVSPVLQALEKDGDNLRRLPPGAVAVVRLSMDREVTMMNWQGSIIALPMTDVRMLRRKSSTVRYIVDLYKDGVDRLGSFWPGRLDATERAAKEIRACACRNFPPAQRMMYSLRQREHGPIPQDLEKSLAWLQLAAVGGDVWSQAELGRRYVAGEGVPQDDELAVFWLKLASAMGNADAAWGLLQLYKGARGGLTRDPVLEEDLLKKAAEARHPAAMVAYREILVERGDWATAKKIYDADAYLPPHARPLSLVAAGGYCESEIAGGADLARGLYLEAMKLDRRCGPAFYRLGLLEAKAGNGPEAFKLFLRANELGCRSAKLELGRCCLLGHGVRRNESRALEYLTAVDCPEASYLLSKIERDGQKAAALLEKAATGGWLAAQTELGHKFFEEIAETRQFTPEKMELTRTYLQKAATAGDGDATVHLAVLRLSDSEEGSVERSAALKTIQDMAAAGNREARCELSALKFGGVVLPKDEAGAIALLEGLVREGHVGAKAHLGTILIARGGENFERGLALVDEAARTKRSALAMYTAAKIWLEKPQLRPMLPCVVSQERAFDMLEWAAAKSFGPAEFAIGESHLMSCRFGVPDAGKKAEAFFLRAAQHGQPQAWLKLGEMYYGAIGGLAVDRANALLLFKRAIDARVASAMLKMGDCCLDPEGAISFEGRPTAGGDMKAAMRWYMEAERCGHVADAAAKMGLLWKKMGNQKMAVACWTRAAEAGSSIALANLGVIYRQQHPELAAPTLTGFSLNLGGLELGIDLPRQAGGGAPAAAPTTGAGAGAGMVGRGESSSRTDARC